MIKFLDLQKLTARYADEYREATGRVVDSGCFLRGEETKAFESAYSAYIGTKYCVGTGNGLDALTLIYRAYIEMGMMSVGDEVLVPANTYIASILSITENGLCPVLIEPSVSTLEIDVDLIERSITKRTRSLLLVHLYGRCAWTDRIGEICEGHDLLLVEDNAQAHGAFTMRAGRGKGERELCRTGSLGHAAGHSFYPSKNLGALGDAGAVTTDDEALAETVSALGNYGSREKYVFDYKGRNSRMDELQAALLAVRLRHLDEENLRRQQIGHRYEQGIRNPQVTLPRRMANGENVYHLFPVLCKDRDGLKGYLSECGIETMTHYPIPPHRQRCYGEWREVSLPVTEKISDWELSLPIGPMMTDEEVEEVVRCVNSFI